MKSWLPGDLLAPSDSSAPSNVGKTILLLKLVAEGKSGLQKWEARIIRNGKFSEEMILLDNPNESGFTLIARATQQAEENEM